MSQTKRALIIGASKGIGLAVVQQLLADGWDVTATYRSTAVSYQHEKLRWLPLDITIATQREQLLQQLKGEQFDRALINAGILGPDSMELIATPDDELMQLFMTNSVAPVRMAEGLLPLLSEKQGVLGITTSRLGSLTENAEAIRPYYSASKMALNMLSRALLQQMDPRGTTLLSLHPGWVKTDMGGDDADITAVESAQGLVAQLNRFSGQGGHHYVDYSGRQLAW
jgi:Dehydrogenases with different specificities (related to short-chain alcohol dehydrogenases)